MDLVVRTPHGDADVSINASATDTSVGDVIASITGQAVPRLAFVDGRTIDATTSLADARLMIGSVVTTEPQRNEPTSSADVVVTQLAGPGSGRRQRLGPGRYRIGPGRRSSAAELDLAPVEHQVVEVDNESTASTTAVTVVADGADVTLEGTPVTAVTTWSGEVLTAGSRAFRLDAPAQPRPARSLPHPDTDGAVAFSRPPRRLPAPIRWPVVDALHDADVAAPSLWERRPDHVDAFDLPFGIHVDDAGASVVCVGLGRERAVAVAGSEHFRSALARALVIEATTLHGPADLDVVVLTSPDRMATWDWAKWLPHLRTQGHPAIIDSRHGISAWVDAAMEVRPERTATPRPLTMLVVDDPELWQRRASPLRPLLSRPPGDVRLVALCDDETRAPAICSTSISEIDDGFARLRSTAGDDVDDIRPALPEVAIAVDVARALAPLVDLEVADPVRLPSGPVDAPEFAALSALTDPSDVVARWRHGTPRTLVAVGRNVDGDGTIEIDVEHAVTLVIGASMGEAFDVAATALLAQCADRSPEQLWVVPLGFDDHATSAQMWRLPHSTERHEPDAAIEPARLLARLHAVLDDPEGPQRIVVVADGSTASTIDARLLTTLADGARTIDGVTMLVVSDQPDVAALDPDTLITVDTSSRHADTPGQRVATTVLAAGAPAGQHWIPPQPPQQRDDGPEIRPFVVGRALTSLERRLAQRLARSSDVVAPAVVAAIDVACAAASADRAGSAAGRRRTAVPPPLPTHLDIEEFLAASPGDGVPLGVTDDPTTTDVSIRWWEPGSGSLLLFGSRRSGIDQVLNTMVIGVSERFAGDDVRLLVVDASPTRRRLLRRLDANLHVVASDDVDAVVEGLDVIEADIDRRRDGAEPADRPQLIVLIADLVQLRRSHIGGDLATRIDDVLVAAAGPNSGVDVIAYASEFDGAGPFAAAATRRLVGASSNDDDLASLGVHRADDLDRFDDVIGRCLALPEHCVVQLATSDTPVETILEARGIDE